MCFECHIIDRGIAVMLWVTSQDKLVSNLSEKYLRKMYCFVNDGYFPTVLVESGRCVHCHQ